METGEIAELITYPTGVHGAGFIQPHNGGALVFFSSRVYVGNFVNAFQGQSVGFERYVGFDEAKRVVP